MQYNKEDLQDFTVYAQVVQTDSTGAQTATLSIVGTGKGDLQPLTGSIKQMQPGVVEESTHILYTAVPGFVIVPANVVEVDGVKYTVVDVQDWGNYYAVRLKEQIL